MYETRTVRFLIVRCNLCETETRLAEAQREEDESPAEILRRQGGVQTPVPEGWVTLCVYESGRTSYPDKPRDKHVCPKCAAKVRT
jgi:hypothetical protein